MFVVSYLNPLWSLKDYVNDHLYLYSTDDLKDARDLCEVMCSVVSEWDGTSPLPPKKEPLPTDTPLKPIMVRRTTF